MTTMIERVAWALRKSEFPCDRGWSVYTHQARTAIEAMREPTDGMIEAVYRSYFWMDDAASDIRDAWSYAIDAALGEKP